MAQTPPNDNRPHQKASAKRVKRELKSQHTSPPQVSQPARHLDPLPLKGGMAKTKKSAARRRQRKLFSQQYWDQHPKIHLTYSALMEFRHREGKIRWGNGRDETPPLKTDCKSVEDFARRGGPDLTHLCDYQHRNNRNREFDVPKLSMPAIYDMNLEGYLNHNGVEKRFGREREPFNIGDLRRIMMQDRSDLDSFGPGAARGIGNMCRQYKTNSNVLPGIYLNLFGARYDSTMRHTDGPLEGTITALKKHFYNLDPIVPHMISARPDLVDGADPKALVGQVKDESSASPPVRTGKRGIGQGKDKATSQPPIHTELEGYITPYHLLEGVKEDKEDPDKMILPNFFLYNICKHDDRLAGERAALHSGALGARALFELEHYGKDYIEFSGKAHTFVAVLATTHMTIYAIHAIPPQAEGRKMDFQITAIKAFKLSDRNLGQDELVAIVKNGVTALRNLREEAHRYRQKLIRKANGEDGDDDDSNNGNSSQSYSVSGSSTRAGSSTGTGSNSGSGGGGDDGGNGGDGGDGRKQYDGSMENGSDKADRKQTVSGSATERKAGANAGVSLLESMYKLVGRRAQP
ncbi:hypothetical protein ASPFODRAFT_146638 [Aspergillus luchuensis CBS 106.47]|uniref:Uncharacterized protein n=1 Tax=Aspergillus luchuensis (strain CBS 106.47) TaxID=1137211 RepID=A0A1M3T2K9_ASPLC|nr:hypothetical protein ASPFODRAFT_146638 [Aspergillus luchuensis CBS 106.47]